MSIEALQEVYSSIMYASSSEQVFGMIGGGNKKDCLVNLKKSYGQISKVVHPDIYNYDLDAQEMANEAFIRLSELYERAKKKVEMGTYGEKGEDYLSRKMVETASGVYYFDFSQPIAEGDKSLIYAGNNGQCGAGDPEGMVVVKILDDVRDNDLMINEIRILEMFKNDPGKQSRHLPVIIDSFVAKEGTKGIILRQIPEMTLPELLHGPYPNGMPTKKAVAVMSRCLSLLGFVHSKGIVHCNIEPDHLIVNRPNHNVVLIDWAYAAYKPFQTNGRFKVLNEPYSAPEVAQGLIPTPSADLYSLAKCIIFLMGGDPKTNDFPSGIDERFKRFLEFFLRESAIQRPRDAWEMWWQLAQLRQEMFGDHVFEPF